MKAKTNIKAGQLANIGVGVAGQGVGQNTGEVEFVIGTSIE